MSVNRTYLHVRSRGSYDEVKIGEHAIGSVTYGDALQPEKEAPYITISLDPKVNAAPWRINSVHVDEGRLVVRLDRRLDKIRKATP